VVDQDPESSDEAHSPLRGLPTTQPLGVGETQGLDNYDPSWLKAASLVTPVRRALEGIGSGAQAHGPSVSHLDRLDGFVTPDTARLRKALVGATAGSRFKRSPSPSQLSRLSPPTKRAKFVFSSHCHNQVIRSFLQSQSASRSLFFPCHA
jgi:hypothetical protein